MQRSRGTTQQAPPRLDGRSARDRDGNFAAATRPTAAALRGRLRSSGTVEAGERGYEPDRNGSFRYDGEASRADPALAAAAGNETNGSGRRRKPAPRAKPKEASPRDATNRRAPTRKG